MRGFIPQTLMTNLFRTSSTLPRHYVSERGILYNVRELDEWLMSR